MRVDTTMRAGLLAVIVLLGACGGDDGGSAAGGTSGTEVPSTQPSGSDATGSPSGSGPEPTAPSGGIDCEQVAADAATLGVTFTVLPQLSSGAAITDELVLGDLTSVRDAVARLGALVGDAGRSALDELGRALDIVERGRAGDADAAAAELQELTGGVEGLMQWNLKMSSIFTDLDAAGCPVG